MWLSLPRLVGVLSPFPILLACASAGARNANVITAPELSRSKAPTAYDAIRQIRPEMLRTRDPGAIVYFKARQPAVAVDHQPGFRSRAHLAGQRPDRTLLRS